MNRGTLCIILLAVCALGIAGCGGSGHLGVTISTAPTTLAVGASSNVVATVVHDPAGAGVTWACTPSIACGQFSFAPASTASGATAVFTAPPAIPVGGQVTITATSVTNTARSATANITITATSVTTNNFVFYASGEEASGATYSLAGVVAITTDGNNTIVGGEQDFNDGVGVTSPQPSGDFISGGSLSIGANGQATLTLITNNPAVGAAGTETFALAYANANHALITQFDGSATSLGSFDLQSATATPVSASFSFVDTGADPTGAATASGGVFTLDGSSTLTGFFDTNDAGTVTLDTPIPAGISAGPTDSLGRGNIIGGLAGGVTINYYVVGPEVLRSIDADSTDTSVGSAYGQGATPAFSAASIGTSVFSVGSSLGFYSAAGQFTTDGASTFAGVGDENESVLNTNPPAIDQAINGTYTIGSDGYGAFLFTSTDLGSVADFGVYAVDPALNILDPNNPLAVGAGGGALIAEMDSLVGIGALIPQTDPALGDVATAVTFGAQGDTNVTNDEFDFVGEGTMAGGVFAGTGALSDPFGALTGTDVESTNAVFNATFAGDGAHPGRSTTGLAVSASNGTDFGTVTLGVTAYQANGGQLFWVETDDGAFFGGSIQANTLVVGGAEPAKPRPNARKH